MGKELYDYKKDPLEKISFVNDPAYKSVIERFKRYADEYFEYFKKKNFLK